MTSQDIGYRGNWEVTYSISKRPLQVVTGAFEQADLMNQFCADDETNCGLTLASATKVLGPAEQASSKVANNGTTTVDDTVKASRTVTTTNSVGIKVTVTAGISKLITTSVSVSYNFSIANSTTYTQSQKLTIPPGMEAWWTMRAEMVRVVGDVVIRDGDTYYLLKNVSYDFPEVGGFSVLTAESSPIGVTGGEPGAPGNPEASDPSGSNPGANAPDSALTATSADAARLANTGSSVDGTPYLLGLLALLIGAGLVLIRGGRSSRRRIRRLGFGSSNRS
jgi:LPXTG-motif cell wall-anchored protein